MSTQPSLFAEQRRIRTSKRQQIEDFFLANLGKKFSTAEMHERWGSAFRSRTSEICRDPNSPITIRNKHWVENGKEMSVYWAERRTQ